MNWRQAASCTSGRSAVARFRIPGRWLTSVLASLRSRFVGFDDDAWLAELPALVRAAWHGDSGEVSRLLAASVERQADSGGWTALHAAAAQGHTEVVAVLLEAGAAVDAVDKHGQTPLLNAAGPSNAASVALLLEAGADLHYRRSPYETPMQRAADWGNADVLKVLLTAGGDPNEQEASGYSLLMAAAEAGTLPCVEVFLAGGARADVISNGMTAASYAARHTPRRRGEPAAAPGPIAARNDAGPTATAPRPASAISQGRD